MENRRLLLAVLLSLVVLIAWSYLFGPEAPPAGREGEAPPAALLEPAPSGAGEAAPGRPQRQAAEPAEVVAEALPEVEEVAAAAEERIVLEAEGLRAEFTNRGAQLVSLELTAHRRTDGGEWVDLVRERQAPPYPFALTGPDGAPLPLSDALFAAEPSPAGDGVSFRYGGPLGRATKVFTLDENGLFEIAIEVPGRADWGIFLGPGLRNPSAAETGGQLARRTAVYSRAGELERIETDDPPETPIPGAGLAWIGLDDSYFLTAVLPRTPLLQVVVEPVLLLPGAEGVPASFLRLPPGGELSDEQEKLGRELALRLEPGAPRFEAASYWGAKSYDRLADLPGGLEKTIDLGWFAFLARPLMLGLEYLHDRVVANYGWAIVLMTLVIKILLLPLTHKSFISMRKMQELNPKIQAIRQRWAGKLKDKQGRPNVEAQRKMNEEIQGLFKQEGVNPAGGCLPMLLQLPVFIAFYQLLAHWVELRNAPWILWVDDLSLPDPHYVLPIVMGATQFVQTWMTPAAGNPAQRRIMLLMPIFFTILFIGFPSGLVLYWLTNNVLSIAQQSVYNHLKERQSDGAGAAGGAKKGSPGRSEARKKRPKKRPAAGAKGR